MTLSSCRTQDVNNDQAPNNVIVVKRVRLTLKAYDLAKPPPPNFDPLEGTEVCGFGRIVGQPSTVLKCISKSILSGIQEGLWTMQETLDLLGSPRCVHLSGISLLTPDAGVTGVAHPQVVFKLSCRHTPRRTLVCKKEPLRMTDDCPAQAKGLLAWVWTGPIDLIGKGSANCLSEVLSISAPASSQRPGLQRREAEFQATRTRGLNESYYTEDTDRTRPPAAPSMGVRQQRSRTYGTTVVKRWLDVRPLVGPQSPPLDALSYRENLPVTDKRSIIVTYIQAMPHRLANY
ncbi:uncharacterized protein EI90DRAFT_3015326 [Cantharellus anzutake]|uniref:uncharacterized protein n=1 Tax=Cantharellus anzutake TaxID=1750568 RepID=UPI001906908B|nr:uncharacterized protein EI90DRAFT_3015326 [Cantharellus anzutake]KAF8333419.1 hypothetical protein EI90DRAFT_3015326 [Cantharellus anzutake]